MNEEQPVSDDIYHPYLNCLLQGNRLACQQTVERLLANNTAVETVYVALFQRSLYEVGSLWERHQISVAVEHLATAITERLLANVFPRVLSGTRIGRRAIISCVANEYHQIGGRMVADTFEFMGWDSHFLGANTPAQDLLEIVQLQKPQVVALSLAVFFNMNHLLEILRLIRERYPHLPLIVGGQAFRWGGQQALTQFQGVRYVPTLSTLKALDAEDICASV